METIAISSWGEFVDQIEALNMKRNSNAKRSTMSVSELFYRGQSNSNYGLKTTLERAVPREIAVSQYFRFVSVVKSKIESVTGKSWVIPSRDEFDERLDGRQYPPFPNLPGYSFFAYLRHHGLPSPLLDWTKSPYVAAHFAMAGPPRQGAADVAVFVYLESQTGMKTGDVDAPTIQHLGPYVTTHRRHYLQQSEYTFCTKGTDRLVHYAPHETVVARSDNIQDLLWKLVIPVSERRTFMENLQRMNINPFSLFGTEEALMEDINLSEIFLRERL